MNRPNSRSICVAAVLALAGCHGPRECDRGSVSRNVEARFGQGFGPTAGQVIVPEGLAQGRPLTEDQSVVLALWNNAAFREALVEIDLTRADLVQAGLLPNPEFVYFWPAHEKPFKYLLDFPVESLWLRPIRLKAAAAENERACARLTQTALDLIRDTRLGYTDLQLAQDRVKVAERSVKLRGRVLELAEARLKDGVASPLEVSTARIDALQAQQDYTRASLEAGVVGERLRNLTGLSATTFPLIADDEVFEPRTDVPLEDLVAEAVATRPDAVAATSAANAAAERVRLARLSWVRLLGLLDATSGRGRGHEFGPAVRMTVPLFNHGQGGVARAKAEQEQLERRQQTVVNQVILDVRQSHARYLQVHSELDFLRKKTRLEVESAIARAEAAYKEGNVTYVIVLEMNRQLIDTYSREALLYADLRRAWAELERGVGRRLR